MLETKTKTGKPTLMKKIRKLLSYIVIIDKVVKTSLEQYNQIPDTYLSGKWFNTNSPFVVYWFAIENDAIFLKGREWEFKRTRLLFGHFTWRCCTSFLFEKKRGTGCENTKITAQNFIFIVIFFNWTLILHFKALL